MIWADFRLNGTRYRASLKTDDKAEACRRAVAMYQDIEAGRAKTPAKEATLGEAIQRYERAHKTTAYWASRRGHLRAMEAYFGTGKKLSGLSDEAIEGFILARLPDAAANTIRNYIASMKALCQYVRDVMGASVGEWQPSLHYRSSPDTVDTFLSHDEARRLIQEIVPHARGIVVVALATGLRRENVISLTWGQVDIANRRLSVVQKRGKRFGVDLPDMALSAIQQAPMASSGPVWKYDGATCHCSHCRSGKHDGEPVRDIRKAFDTARRAIGRPDVRFHDLRHTLASWLLQQGQTLAVVKEVLGHSKITTTQRYAHLEKGQGRDAVSAALQNL